MRLSIVTTLYRSSPTINEFYRRVIAAAEPITQDIELVLVNDGSPDDTLDLALVLHRADPRVVVVDLARNFGHHKAMMTGRWLPGRLEGDRRRSIHTLDD